MHQQTITFPFTMPLPQQDSMITLLRDKLGKQKVLKVLKVI